MGEMVTVRPAGAEAYPVHIGSQTVGELPRLIGDDRAAVALVCDHHLSRLYAQRVREVLGDRLPVECVEFPAGEENKNRTTKEMIEDFMLEKRLGRDGLVLALGGGVTCDLAGFVASTYLRGVPWIAVPTSLLAAVDASVGGKTGVNTGAGKNLVGRFHQPRAVVIDLDLLTSLPAGEVDNGLAEMVKHALVADRNYLEQLVAQASGIRALVPDALLQPVRRSVEIKSAVVSIDPGEADLRQVLNCGHTIGHAIELLGRYRLSHGQAVAAGLSVEAGIALRLGILPESELVDLRVALGKLGLPVSVPEGMPARALLEATRIDKKGRQGKPRYALPQAIGKMARGPNGYAIQVDDSIVLAAIEEASRCSV